MVSTAFSVGQYNVLFEVLLQSVSLIDLFSIQESPKGDFNWAATGRFFLSGGGGCTHKAMTLEPHGMNRRDELN